MSANGADTVGQVAGAILEIRNREGALPAERQLADRLQIKRHLLRRALIDLRAKGALPTSLPRPRRFEPGPDSARQLARDSNPVEVIEMRLMIEPTLARLAALRASPNQIANMQAALRSRSGDLHRMIATAAGNGLAKALHEMIRTIDRDVRVSSHVEDMHPIHDSEEHQTIIAAIVRRDPDAAEAAMRVHLASIHRMLSSALG